MIEESLFWTSMKLLAPGIILLIIAMTLATLFYRKQKRALENIIKACDKTIADLDKICDKFIEDLDKIKSLEAKKPEQDEEEEYIFDYSYLNEEAKVEPVSLDWSKVPRQENPPPFVFDWDDEEKE